MSFIVIGWGWFLGGRVSFDIVLVGACCLIFVFDNLLGELASGLVIIPIVVLK